MMRVDEKIKQIVESIPGLSYEFNDWTRANVKFDYKKFPVCLYVLPASGVLSNKNGNFRDYPNVLIAFLDKADLDFEGEENEPIVERMKTLAKEFVLAVNNSRMFEELPEDINYRTFYDTTDANLTGVGIEIQLKELVGLCVDKNGKLQ